MKLAKLYGGVFLLLACALQGETEPSTIKVAAILKSASAFISGNPSIDLAPGADLKEGAVVTTGPKSAVDLFLGNQAGTIRLTENATLAITKFYLNSEGEVQEIQLHLSSGSLLGLGNQLPKEKRYQVKVNSGIVDVQARHFRVRADGFVVTLSGKLLFAHVAAEGSDPVLHTLEAPPPVYFWPSLGVRPAPGALVSEVMGQSTLRLPSR